ncbi:enoyl-CoA hydratase/isomerase family protein [Aidingimonas halophila]|uniref:3-hydroxyisobutyryl-CoA hydrolase n=1 Tax=Aidingimonas halophila TaxID=574349 RepID=A0A1H3B688_9GAMM|nr:enoyl-CoA hydratase/isomerase family protein [Aidingimonas halophila]GHC25911.1 enoyl-CoA hydratase [Aidingimonas halophila]SDX36934.1 Enoyl-CoA hydratase/carnithine racemase [Aidingimonas halophila]
MTETPVRFEEKSVRNGGRIGIAILNAPRSLNALSLAMIDALTSRLDDWAQDDAIVAVWLEGEGDKAFCAGGDIVALYRAMQHGEAEVQAFATRYFTAEYALDHRIHVYPKPLLVWGDGIVMGGGLGLMAGARQRLVTETSLLAMPEITIGLYPDVAASWFLNHMPSGIGAYLALTGAQLNARDALDLGLADRFIPRERRNELLEALLDADYSAGLEEAAIMSVLDAFEARSLAPPGRVWCERDHVHALTGVADVNDAVSRILDDSREDNSWLTDNRTRLASGCPLTAHIAWRMLERHRHSSLSDVFRDELNLSVQCCLQGDLGEGVRALLIDKDKRPRWRHADVADVLESDVEAMLTPLWSEPTHPLRHL